DRNVTGVQTCALPIWDPSPVGAHPGGASAFGVHDLVGNGWEWTRTEFAPFPGFTPMPFYAGYSANFFDGKHYVMKGGSPRTAARSEERRGGKGGKRRL